MKRTSLMLSIAAIAGVLTTAIAPIYAAINGSSASPIRTSNTLELPTRSNSILVAIRTPSGSFTLSGLKKKPFEGIPVSVEFEDGRAKHTKVGEYTQAQLQAILNLSEEEIKSKSSAQKTFWKDMKRRNYSYGSQLNSDAVRRYKELVQLAIERGKHNTSKPGEFTYRANFKIGFDIKTGKPTNKYKILGTLELEGKGKDKRFTYEDVHVIPLSP